MVVGSVWKDPRFLHDRLKRLVQAQHHSPVHPKPGVYNPNSLSAVSFPAL